MAEPQRKAKNEAVFREVNERIGEAAVEFGVPGEASFVCECGDSSCTDMVGMSLVEYNDVRAHGRRFVTLPGHEEPAIERVVLRTSRFYVVEKTGAAGEVVADLDPRD